MASKAEEFRRVVPVPVHGDHALEYTFRSSENWHWVDLTLLCWPCGVACRASGWVADSDSEFKPRYANHIMADAFDMFVETSAPACFTSMDLRRVWEIMES